MLRFTRHGFREMLIGTVVLAIVGVGLGFVLWPLALIVMQPAAGILEVAPPPAGTCVFTRYSLDGAPVTPAA